jgi:hypothetical protein
MPVKGDSRLAMTKSSDLVDRDAHGHSMLRPLPLGTPLGIRQLLEKNKAFPHILDARSLREELGEFGWGTSYVQRDIHIHFEI